MPAIAYARAASQYQGVGLSAGVIGANPHQLINMLLVGALDRVSIARAAIVRGDNPEKARRLTTAVAIVQELAGCLNHQQGGAMADNLYRLYDYVMRLLVDANRSSSVDELDQATELLQQLHRAWERLPSVMARPQALPAQSLQ